jgi:hypothetical protein
MGKRASMAGNGGNGVTLRDSALEARQKVRWLAEEGRTVEQIDRALSDDGPTELERDIAHLLATHEVRRGSEARTSARYWQDIDHEIGG